MRTVRTTTENNLITIHFGMQEVSNVEAAACEDLQPQEESTTCEGGVCALNWSPVRPAKKAEAA